MSRDPSTADSLPDYDALKRMINDLAPKSEVFSGKKFFSFLLERRGPLGVVNFVKKASGALDKSNDLDLSYDFDEVEKEIFKKSYLQPSRRNFLRSAAWQIGGAITFVDAALKLAASGVDVAKPDSTPASKKPASNNKLQDISDTVNRHALPAAELLIGAALIYEGHENKIEMKLEQISDAVIQLAEQLQQAQTSSTASAAASR